MTPRFDRRRFLQLAALGAAAVACGRGSPAAPSPFGGLTLAPGAEPGLMVFPGAGELLAGRRTRLPFGLATPDGFPLDAASVRLWVATADEEPRGPFEPGFHSWLLPEPGQPQGFYAGTVALGAAGITDVLVEAHRLDRTWFGTAAFTVRQNPAAPAPGAEAVRTRTPTVERPSEWLCTREPRCPMHARSLHEALRDGGPVVFTIGSPLLCTSRTCGPVIEEVLDVRTRLGDRVAFVHLEPYENERGATLNAAASSWRIESEPWVFVIAGGKVVARFEGPVSAGEIEPAVEAVL